MDFYEAIRSRYSVRRYEGRPIPDDVRARLLDAIRFAPSACNNQPWHFILVQDEAKRREVAAACMGQHWIAGAPLVVVGCGWESRAYRSMGGYWNSLAVDLAIALDHLTLAAAAEGLGTCWIGAFDEAALKEALGIPEEVLPVALTPVGYPAAPVRHTPRKPLEEITSVDGWPA
jgi:nitroreductase